MNRLDSSVGLGAEEDEARHKDIAEEEEEEEDDPIAQLPLSRAGGQAAAPHGGGGGDAMSMLASYYGLAGDDAGSAEDEIDRQEFSMEAYVRTLLQQDGLETLLTKDDELVQEVKRLDSDMQMLVYENYSKFISATDTIRTMKNNVNDMKAEMDALVKNMEGIASRMQVVNSFLGGKRAKVDKLVSVRRLLKRLDFLFDLPINLNRYVQRQDYAMAVTCYTKAIDILRQHTHVPSFKSIQRESDQIIGGVRDELQRRVSSSLQDDTISPAQLAQYVRLLLELGTPKAELQATVLKAYRTRFAKTLGALQTEEDRKAQAAVASATDASNGFGGVVEEALGRLDQAFLKDFEEAVVMYRALFVAGADAAPTGKAELLELIQTFFTQQYLETVKSLFKANLAVVAKGSRGENKHYPLAALHHLLQGGIVRLHKQAKEAGILEADIALVQDVVKGIIFLEFRGLQATALQRLAALQPSSSSKEQLDAFFELTAQDLNKALEALHGLLQVAEDKVQAALAEAATATSASSTTSPKKASSKLSTVATDLSVGQYVFQFLTWLADAGERLAGATFRLTENDVVEVGEARRRVFPERFFAHATSFSSLLSSEQVPVLVYPTQSAAAAAPPQYALLLAVLCRDLQTTLLPKASAAVARIYPSTASAITGNSSVGANKLSSEDVVVCLNQIASRLLQHFVEAQGHELGLLMKAQGLDQAASGAGGGSSEAVTQATWGKAVVLRLEALVKELSAALGVSAVGVGLAAGRRGERADLSRPTGGLGGRKGVHVDIERIFTVKVQVFGPVDFTPELILLAVLKVACKALIEWTRQATLSRRGYCQLQVDVQLLRQAVGAYVKDASVLETLLEETLISAGERTAESLQGLDPSSLTTVINAEYSRLCMSVAGAPVPGMGGVATPGGGVRR